MEGGLVEELGVIEGDPGRVQTASDRQDAEERCESQQNQAAA